MTMEFVPKIVSQKEGVNNLFAENFTKFRNNKITPLIEDREPTLFLQKKSVILENNAMVEISPILYLHKDAVGEIGELIIGQLGVLLIATNESDAVVGYRHITGRLDTRRKTMVVSSTISVGITGVGLGKELDKMNLELMQDIVNHSGVDTVWKITNDNWNRYKIANEALGADKENPKLQATFNQLKKEQEAWTKLYGENGSLGFTVTEKNETNVPLSCERIFSPVVTHEPSKQSEDFDHFLSGATDNPDPRATEFLEKICSPASEN